MKRLFLVAMILLAGCKPKDGAVGPTGPSGAPGDAIPSYQVVFKQSVSPIATFSGFTLTSPLQFSPTTANLNDGLIRTASAGQTIASRVLIRCDISGWIPQNATITSAVLKLTSTGTNISGASVTVGAFDVSIPAMVDSGSCIWTAAATWERYNGVILWDNCGGATSGSVMVRGQQFAQDPMDTVIIPTTTGGQSLMWGWNLTPSVVQKWVNEPTKNNGIVLASVNEWNDSATGDIHFDNPSASTQLKPELIVNYYIP